MSASEFRAIDKVLLQIIGFSWFLTTLTALAMVLKNCLASDPLLYRFHKKPIICEKMSLTFLPNR